MQSRVVVDDDDVDAAVVVKNEHDSSSFCQLSYYYTLSTTSMDGLWVVCGEFLQTKVFIVYRQVINLVMNLLHSSTV